MNCCKRIEETKKEDKQEEQGEHSHGGCGMHGGWMRWLWIGLLILLAASYVLQN